MAVSTSKGLQYGRRVGTVDLWGGESALVQWAKLSGFAVVGVALHTSLYFAGGAIPKKRVLVEDRPDRDRAPLVAKLLEEEDIVEVLVKQEEESLEGGVGERAKGDEGTMGKDNASATNKRFAVKGPQDNPDPHIARQAALRDAQEFGMIGLLNSGAGGDPDAPTAPWGRDDSMGADAVSARGNMWGSEIGDAFGAGGLGLSGIGEGGGGRGEGIGLGNIGTIGHGAGTGTGQGFGNGNGRLAGSHRNRPPSVRMGATSVNGRLPPEVIQRIVRQNFGRFRLCYESALTSNPNLSGSVTVSFTIAEDGSTSKVSAKSEMGDAGMISCIQKSFMGLSFPQPEGGTVAVVYPVAFSPGDGGGGADSTAKPPPPTVVSLSESSSSDVSRALRAAGASVQSSEVNGAATVFKVEQGGKSLTVTFVRASSASALTKEQLAYIAGLSAVRRSGGAILAVECEDSAAASALLSSLPK